MKNRTRLIPVKDKPKGQQPQQQQQQAPQESKGNLLTNFMGMGKKDDKPATNAPAGTDPNAPVNPNDPNYQGANDGKTADNKQQGPELSEQQK